MLSKLILEELIKGLLGPKVKPNASPFSLDWNKSILLVMTSI